MMQIVILELNKVSPSPIPFLEFTLISQKGVQNKQVVSIQSWLGVIILLLYVDDIVLMARHPSYLDKQIRILKVFCYNMGMIVNTDKTKIMIIKSKKDTYANLIYDNRNLEELTSYNYLGIHFNQKLNWNYIAMRK